MSEPIHFDLFSPQYHNNLYSIFTRLRDEAPVFRDESSGAWVITRFEDARTVLKDKKRFKNSETRQDVIPQLQAVDDELHKTLRAKVLPHMMAESVEYLVPEVRRVCSELFDAFAEKGEGDILAEVINQIPRRIVSPFLGIPEHMREPLYELVDPLMGWDPEQPVFPPATVADDLRAFAFEVLEYRRDNPGQDLFSQLLVYEAAGELDTEGVVIIVCGIAFAAFDTTINLMANGTMLLANAPEQREKLRSNPEMITQAMEEMLRLESPTQLEPRRVAEAVNLHGVELAIGDEVLVMLGAANRDGGHYPSPEIFDVERNPKDHLGFGFGVHKCIGQYLARMEARVYFEELLQRYPDFQVGEPRWMVSHWARALVELHFSPGE